MNTTRYARSAGFTLVEAIMVIVITGVIAGMVAVFIRAPVEGYVDTVARAELTEAGDSALRRIGRDVRAALPNSLRPVVLSGGATWCFEFLPTIGGGRYRVDQSAAGGNTPLDFTAAASSFDVLAYSGTAPAVGQSVVIYNLGIPGSDAYEAAGTNRAAVAAGSNASSINLTPATRFPFRSPGNRFHVIPNNSVVYTCRGGQILQVTQAIAANAGVCPAGGAVLVGNVDCANSSYDYAVAASQRNGLLSLTLTLTQAAAHGNETIHLSQEVHVDNTP